MPYINLDKRQPYDPLIAQLLDKLVETHVNGERTLDPGHLNYVISSLAWSLFVQDPSYRRANDIIGVLEAAKLEFYRRQAAPYEDKKIEENGDL